MTSIKEKQKQNWKRWYYKNRKEYLAKERNYERKHILDIYHLGKKIRLIGNKRQYPKDQKCEVCKTERKLLAYHHWNDKDISKGIWCCVYCHAMCELVDRKLYLQYLKIKEEINNGR